ncbi:beta-ketoacyl-ACP synthase II [Helicobacter sp. 11S02629-2]|uniref:beta-ketoacyl-ACP synthase II n=1 Tax=Helicobacter sp. 11S02629-2 TaxID=1476195 RepID=UPI000BA7C186|nr:beta-ketoacyl-ACP synthase II [Helicobacter sp. 11S02629-2]PAF45730.1 beta-ketoacyl-ACP synthase II [Helicobacter sp. 11S02629-2]
MRRIAVVGLGMVNALGLDKETSFPRIVAGESGVKKIESFDVEGFPVQIAAEITNFDPEVVLNPKDFKKAHRFIQLGLLAAKEALEESGLLDSEGKVKEELRDRFGICSASGIGGLGNIEANSIACHDKGPKRVTPFFIPSALVNMLSGFASIEFNIKGPNLSCVTACAAGTHAIIDAIKTIALDGADRVLVVGAESAICPVGIGGFAAMRALSTRNDDPKTASRPFDKDRDGFVMGEGAGALVLEDYDLAKARGAKIYGEIVGFGESSDANHITTPAPGGEGAYRAMKAAMDMTKKKYPDMKIDYINAHGTSTGYNDLFETQALRHAFPEGVPPVSSTKGQIGHCLGAAGAIEAVISLLALEANTMPPTINQFEKDPECDLDYIPNVARKKDLNFVMSNSFGFGGTNGVVIFKRCEA